MPAIITTPRDFQVACRVRWDRVKIYDEQTGYFRKKMHKCYFYAIACTPKKISSEFRTLSEFTKNATHSFCFCCSNLSEFCMDIMNDRIVKPIQKICSRVILRKHPTLLAKNARNPYSLGMAKLVWQCTEPVLFRYGQVGLAVHGTVNSSVWVTCVFRKQSTYLLFWDTTLSYYNHLILSKNS